MLIIYIYRLWFLWDINVWIDTFKFSETMFKTYKNDSYKYLWFRNESNLFITFNILLDLFFEVLIIQLLLHLSVNSMVFRLNQKEDIFDSHLRWWWLSGCLTIVGCSDRRIFLNNSINQSKYLYFSCQQKISGIKLGQKLFKYIMHNLDVSTLYSYSTFKWRNVQFPSCCMALVLFVSM